MAKSGDSSDSRQGCLLDPTQCYLDSASLHLAADYPCGNTSTTTTVIDSKNGSVPRSPGKVLKRTVTEDIMTTFSSPAAWLLVIALIITWSAVAIVMFDLVDYKNFSASSIAQIHKEKTEKQEKPERKTQIKVTHREKEKAKGKEKEKGKEKPEKKATHKEKIEKKEKPEAKTVAKEEKKAKTKEKTEEKTKKEVKAGKQEKVKQTAAKVKDVQKTPPKPKVKDKDDEETTAVSKREQKDQYAFCRYMIDMFVHGDLKPGQSPALPPPLPTEQASRPTPASPALVGK
ncbi:triadin [Trichechus manatus latirostris]|uniref:Triadin n=1 Tax=Trichechus manatus latirostris TaxID=127582 RepID=A0A2Y9DY85_TRIMA|nr:triadin [Trichechus manatus latirostris]